MKSQLIVAAFAATLTFACSSERDHSTAEAKMESAPAETEASYYSEEMPASSIADTTSYTQDENLSGNTKTENDFSLYSSSAASEFNGDSSRKFIRTADLRFRVKDVRKSTYAIEDIVANHAGFVETTHLSNNVQRVKSTPISNDSTLESTYSVLENSMTLRVPAKHLDSVLRKIGREVDFLEYRNIDANDISFDLLAQQLLRKRLAKFNQRLSKAIDDKGKKLDDIEGAENALLYAAEQSDNSLIEKLRQLDKVEYATVTLFFYQRESVKHEMLANEANINAYEPSFWSKMGDSFYDGWKVIEIILIGITKAWFFILLGAAIAFLVIRNMKKEKKG